MKSALVALLIGVGVWLLGTKAKAPAISGLGVGGKLRYGQPKTEAERLAAHQVCCRTSTLPQRGTGVKSLW